DVAAHIAAVSAPDVGGIATFIGTVRNHSPGADGEVVELVYSAHPSAGDVMTRIVSEVQAKDPQVGLAATRRIGALHTGVVVSAGPAHRAEAFEARRLLVEEIKARIPVWKKQVLADGSYTWVGAA